jgi:hypothetical protein
MQPPVDAGDESDADTGASLPDISGITGMTLWLDATYGVTKDALANVSAWADRSSKKNDATQPDPGRQPVFEGSAINGIPALRMTSSVLGVAVNDGFEIGTGDYAFAAVAKVPTSDGGVAGGGMPFSVGSYTIVGGFPLVTGAHLVFNPPTRVGVATGNLGGGGEGGFFCSAVSLPSGAGVVVVRRTSGVTKIRVDGKDCTAQSENSPSSDLSVDGGPVTVGSLVGYLGEFVTVKGTLGDSDLALLESYLIQKYGL